MGLILETIYTEGLSQISYLVGDDRTGVAAIIDPRRDVAEYLARAQARGVRITHAIETHIHADFVSGALELQAYTGCNIWGGRTDDYSFPLHEVAEGDELRLGNITLRVLHTPGHTPEHISLLLSDSQQGKQPFAVFTGDTLFNLDVGRPDLPGSGATLKLARQLYDSVYGKLLPLGDRMEVYPAHGAGSACGKSIGDRRRSTIGNERLFNPALQFDSKDEFTAWLLNDLPEAPGHYRRLKKMNGEGAPVTGGVPVVPSLPPQRFRDMAQDEDTLVLDVRSMLAFGGGHIPGAINIGFAAQFANWAGWMIDPDRQILLVGESDRDIPEVASQLYCLGFDHLLGYLHNGMTSWMNAGLPLQHIQEWTVQELNERRGSGDVQVLDVRSDIEFAGGSVPGARHAYVPHLQENLGGLDREKIIATYCGTGYRASIAASLLQRNGYKNIANIPGSWQAWKAAGLPVEAHPQGGEGASSGLKR